ncbi:hypothetical protein ABZX85_39790 [Streptomyces sp. NPDC004539]|uniref:hypothetical protein n=1 Tax=Streptomyces sp. NPDC004539 TaxID=3154280 RepID=UPI0033A90810
MITETTHSPARQHPLGLGIQFKQEYKVRAGVARLPKAPDGLRFLKEITALPVPLLGPGLAKSAWGQLLGHPGLIAELERPAPERMQAAGLLVPTSLPAERLREFVIAVVVRPSGMVLADGGLNSIPLAGVGRLLIETSEHNSSISVNAWLSAQWVASSAELIGLLEEEFLRASSATQRAGRRSGVVALVESNVAAEVGNRLDAAAAVCGYELTTFEPPEFHDSAMNLMRSRVPSHLLVQSTLLNESSGIMKAFSRVSTRRVMLLDSAGSHGVLAALRARLHEAAGVSPGLMIFGEAVAEAEEDGYAYIAQIPLPVKKMGRKAHHSRFKAIVECLDAQLWYSRDLADHSRSGTVAFKCFRSGTKGLEWVADLDENAKIVIGKHKGPVGVLIPWEELGFS